MIQNMATSTIILDVSRGYGSSVKTWSASLNASHEYLLSVRVYNATNDWGAHLYWYISN